MQKALLKNERIKIIGEVPSIVNTTPLASIGADRQGMDLEAPEEAHLASLQALWREAGYTTVISR